MKLVFYTTVQGYDQASIFEKKLKDWSRAKKQALIDANWDKLKEAATCLNDTSHKLYKKDVSSTLDITDKAIIIEKKNVSTTLDKSEETN